MKKRQKKQFPLYSNYFSAELSITVAVSAAYNIMAKSTPFLHRQYINNQLRSSRPGIVPVQVRQSFSVSKTIGKTGQDTHFSEM